MNLQEEPSAQSGELEVQSGKPVDALDTNVPQEAPSEASGTEYSGVASPVSDTRPAVEDGSLDTGASGRSSSVDTPGRVTSVPTAREYDPRDPPRFNEWVRVAFAEESETKRGVSLPHGFSAEDGKSRRRSVLVVVILAVTAAGIYALTGTQKPVKEVVPKTTRTTPAKTPAPRRNPSPLPEQHNALLKGENREKDKVNGAATAGTPEKTGLLPTASVTSQASPRSTSGRPTSVRTSSGIGHGKNLSTTRPSKIKPKETSTTVQGVTG